MSIVGRTYLLRGEPVVVEIQWASYGQKGTPRAPRNVMIRYPDGHRVVRPFRGLRVPPSDDVSSRP